MFYTNVAQYGNQILEVGYDTRGEKFLKKDYYEPTLYVPAKDGTQGQYKTLDNKEVEAISLSSIKEAREFVEKYGEVSNFAIYGFNKWKYTYIAEKYDNDIKFDTNLIRVMTIDIEVMMPKGGFDNFVEDANEPVTAITIRTKDDILVFGYKEDYKPKDRKVRYVYCKDEYDMLGRFIEIYNSKHWLPDVITGWNVEFFDVPYLVNRITKVLGKDQARRLSPWGILFEKSVYSFGRDQQSFVPLGVSILDYLQLYKKFTYNQQESYTLNHISHVELNEKKIDYSEYENLDELYENDYEKYIDYNIHDVNLVHQLDEKLKLMDLIFVMSYDAKINYNDSLGSVLPWEVVIYNYLKEHNIVMPFKKQHDKDDPYTGAFVKSPIIGLHEWIVSYDLTSLYPHLIIQYNISPETKVGKKGGVTVDAILEEKIRNDTEYSMAANGCLYDRVRSGFLPALMKRFFTKRKLYKEKMIEYKKLKEQGEKVDNEIARYNNAQMAMKIFLNSAYGAIGNKYFTFYDNDNAEAITLSGQLSIRWVEKHINNVLNNKMETVNEDYVIAMDTDSMYLNLGPVVHKHIAGNLDRTSNSANTSPISDLGFSDYDLRVADILDSFSERFLSPQIDKAYEKLAKIMNVFENAMFMKREAISNRGVWKAKKMYLLNVIDNEGVRYTKPDLKIMGLESVRSSVPEVCREALKECFFILMNKNEDALVEYVADFRNRFEKMSFADVSFPRGVKGMDKYRDRQTIYKKGTPIHVKGSLLYNMLIRKYNLSLNPIYDGDKIKFSYLKVPNPIHDTVIAAPGYLPKEFKLDQYIDREKQFQKSFLEPLKAITDLMDWKTEKSMNLEDFF
jgi:DNA polymerase elongation subunit (family B)